VAHEWGVFVLENGRPTYLDELVRELPPFVQRLGGPQAVVRPPPPPPPGHGPGIGPAPIVHPPGTVARKPVLFLYAAQPTRVHIEVGFTGGEPWMAYPGAQRGTNIGTAGTAGLVWDLTVAPRRAPAFHGVHRGHWWKDLRAAGGNAVVTDAGQSEGFVFFDGPVAFERSFNLDHQDGGAAVTPASTERILFLLEGDRYVEADLDPDTWRSRQVAMGGMAELRARLDQELQHRGLTLGEAHSLLETWRDELFRAPDRRAIYFVPRDAYDRMLPLTLTPAPAELIRVGLVIDRGTTRPRRPNRRRPRPRGRR
ncbi:MAG: hypothetical protein JRH11_22995, partial [Deltaproteobacteria bacterium]|nr:hypothetical protein [Deltaproteobacteria bacterium]